MVLYCYRKPIGKGHVNGLGRRGPRLAMLVKPTRSSSTFLVGEIHEMIGIRCSSFIFLMGTNFGIEIVHIGPLLYHFDDLRVIINDKGNLRLSVIISFMLLNLVIEVTERIVVIWWYGGVICVPIIKENFHIIRPRIVRGRGIWTTDRLQIRTHTYIYII